jgi:hypothetical protein
MSRGKRIIPLQRRRSSRSRFPTGGTGFRYPLPRGQAAGESWPVALQLGERLGQTAELQFAEERRAGASP